MGFGISQFYKKITVDYHLQKPNQFRQDNENHQIVAVRGDFKSFSGVEKIIAVIDIAIILGGVTILLLGLTHIVHIPNWAIGLSGIVPALVFTIDCIGLRVLFSKLTSEILNSKNISVENTFFENYQTKTQKEKILNTNSIINTSFQTIQNKNQLIGKYATETDCLKLKIKRIGIKKSSLKEKLQKEKIKRKILTIERNLEESEKLLLIIKQKEGDGFQKQNQENEIQELKLKIEENLREIKTLKLKIEEKIKKNEKLLLTTKQNEGNNIQANNQKEKIKKLNLKIEQTLAKIEKFFVKNPEISNEQPLEEN